MYRRELSYIYTIHDSISNPVIGAPWMLILGIWHAFRSGIGVGYVEFYLLIGCRWNYYGLDFAPNFKRN